MIGKIRDTLIGLWPVIKTYWPSRGTILAAIVAFLIGLAWAYRFDPIQFYNADPRTLGQSWQDAWVGLVADRFEYATSRAVVTEEFRQSITNLLGAVDQPAEIVNRLGYVQIADLAANAQTVAPEAPPQPSLLAELRPWILGPILLTVGLILGSLLYGFYIQPIVVDPIVKRIKRRGKGPASTANATVETTKAAREIARQLGREADAAPATSSLGPPVVRHVSIYMPGRAYDDSFSIEDAQKEDEFLGECGVAISETIGVGQPERMSAAEIWLFDKEDFVRTLTGVFASEHAVNDPTIRAKLSAKGEIVLAQPGAVLNLDTNTLHLQARVVEVIYGAGPLPPNSYFDKLTIELQVWRRVGAPAVAAPPAPPIARPAPAPMPIPAAAPAPSFAPPPAPQSYMPPSQPAPPPPAPSFPPRQAPPPTPSFGVGSPAPLRPPPLQPPPPRRTDDDPFGGTGDFTPLR